MNNQFDELTKNLAQSVTRRAALKKLGVGLAGMALACFGLANKARATTHQGYCEIVQTFGASDLYYTGTCIDINGCVQGSSADCPPFGTSAGIPTKGGGNKFQSACGSLYKSSKGCSFTL